MSRSENTAGQASGSGGGAQGVRRLDAAAAEVGKVSRRRAQRLIADGAVRLNGRVAGPGEKGRMIGPGDAVEVDPDVGRVVPQPEMPLVELASGPGWVAVDKPAGVPVHPLHEGETGTVLNAIAARFPQVQGIGGTGGEGGLKSGVVHRLDSETSGVLLVALDEAAWCRFREAFARHRTAKTYLAVVAGQPEPEGRVELDLAVTRHRPARVEVVGPSHPGARRCDLSWRIQRNDGRTSLVAIELGTGFLHQIRATFRHLGHPIVGDTAYAPGQPLSGAPRLMLHAHRLQIDGIDVTSPPPSVFAGWAGPGA